MAKVKGPYDVVVIGGGFYGCMIAIFLRKYFKKILIIEAEKDLLTRASYNNQARVHNGYHYPRNFVTASRSHKNYARFTKDFKKAIFDEFKMIYAIVANTSKTTSLQFVKFCNQIGSSVSQAGRDIKSIFNKSLIENAYEVDEYVFNAAVLRKILKEKLDILDIQVKYKTKAIRVDSEDKTIRVYFENGNSVSGKQVFNCSYFGINTLLENSKMDPLPFKHEFIEMPLIKVPTELSSLSVTILDGPFFGFLHFPDQSLHSLWHVSYAIRANWADYSPVGLEKKTSQNI